MHTAERRLLLAIYQRQSDFFLAGYESVRTICNRVGNYKQNCYYLEKWTRKGWYDWGVSLDMGWLTTIGVIAAEIAAQQERIAT